MRYLKGVTLAALIAIGLVASMQALPSHGILHEYYSDDSFGEVVGTWYAPCTGSPHLTGTRTAYVYYEEWECSTGNYFTCFYGANCTFDGGGNLSSCYPIDDVCGGPY